MKDWFASLEARERVFVGAAVGLAGPIYFATFQASGHEDDILLRIGEAFRAPFIYHGANCVAFRRFHKDIATFRIGLQSSVSLPLGEIAYGCFRPAFALSRDFI